MHYPIPLELEPGEHVLAVVVVTTGTSPRMIRTQHVEELAADGRAYARIMRHIGRHLAAVSDDAHIEGTVADAVEDAVREVLP